ncbi:MAG TPA: Rieske 2Fe-2S domain-containing protein [Acidimicrobiales bacterium]|nr:Rieske 2Fe-2S domain-containing protein [Acidimicrobiales bacterium]
MDTAPILLLSVLGLIVLAAVLVFSTARRRDLQKAREESATSPASEATAPGTALEVSPERTGREVERDVAMERRGGAPDVSAAPPPLAIPPDEETLGVTRRQVLNRGIVGGFTLLLSGFGAAMLAMLWPSLSGGFGSKIRAGKLEEILKEIDDKKEPFYLAAGRFYINPYPISDVPKAKAVQAYSAVLEGYEDGVVALYQKCVHLGCRVPWCKPSQWFECPCHGSQYNRVGEKKGGPAPRGLDRFPVTVEGGVVIVDTKTIVQGPPIGTNTTGQEAEGPHCIGATSEKH